MPRFPCLGGGWFIWVVSHPRKHKKVRMKCTSTANIWKKCRHEKQKEVLTDESRNNWSKMIYKNVIKELWNNGSYVLFHNVSHFSPVKNDGLQLCFQSLLTYKTYQKHLIVFRIWKPACPLSGASIQTIITYSDEQKERWSVQQRNCLPKQSLLQLYSMVSDSGFLDMMLLAVIICYCGYLNGFMKDQWRIIIQTDIQVLLIHLTMVLMSLKMPNSVKYMWMHRVPQSCWKHFCKMHYIFLSSICYDSIAQISMHVLRTMFPGRLISHCGTITWPACLTDFAVPYHFLWVYVESKVYETRSAKIHDLKQRIRKRILGYAFHRNCTSVLNDTVVT